MYCGLPRVKRRRRIKQRDKTIEGTAKMEQDAKDGRDYSLGLHLREDEGEDSSEEPRSKRARMKGNNNERTYRRESECKCGAKDHLQSTSKKCPWKGMSREEVALKYEQRVEEMKRGE